MHTLDDIQQALSRLSYAQRDRILTWLTDTLAFEGVREAAEDYRSDPERRRLSVEEYFAFEELSPVRHEYIGGVLYAMSGASENHELVAGSFFAALYAHYAKARAIRTRAT